MTLKPLSAVVGRPLVVAGGLGEIDWRFVFSQSRVPFLRL
jgi:hypothetical protein